MATVVVLGPNLLDQSEGTFHVHKAGCADLGKRKYATIPARDKADAIEATTYRDVVRYIYPPGDFGYDEDTELDDFAGDIKFFDCSEL